MARAGSSGKGAFANRESLAISVSTIEFVTFRRDWSHVLTPIVFQILCHRFGFDQNFPRSGPMAGPGHSSLRRIPSTIRPIPCPHSFRPIRRVVALSSSVPAMQPVCPGRNSKATSKASPGCGVAILSISEFSYPAAPVSPPEHIRPSSESRIGSFRHPQGPFCACGSLLEMPRELETAISQSHENRVH